MINVLRELRLEIARLGLIYSSGCFQQGDRLIDYDVSKQWLSREFRRIVDESSSTIDWITRFNSYDVREELIFVEDRLGYLRDLYGQKDFTKEVNELIVRIRDLQVAVKEICEQQSKEATQEVENE